MRPINDNYLSLIASDLYPPSPASSGSSLPVQIFNRTIATIKKNEFKMFNCDYSHTSISFAYSRGFLSCILKDDYIAVCGFDLNFSEPAYLHTLAIKVGLILPLLLEEMKPFCRSYLTILFNAYMTTGNRTTDIFNRSNYGKDSRQVSVVSKTEQAFLKLLEQIATAEQTNTLENNIKRIREKLISELASEGNLDVIAHLAWVEEYRQKLIFALDKPQPQMEVELPPNATEAQRKKFLMKGKYSTNIKVKTEKQETAILLINKINETTLTELKNALIEAYPTGHQVFENIFKEEIRIKLAVDFVAKEAEFGVRVMDAANSDTVNINDAWKQKMAEYKPTVKMQMPIRIRDFTRTNEEKGFIAQAVKTLGDKTDEHSIELLAYCLRIADAPIFSLKPN